LLAPQTFANSLARYLSLIQESTTEASIRHHCLGFLREALDITLEQEDGLEVLVFRGRVDAVLGWLVFEFKRDLGLSLADAEGQLKHYLGQLHQINPEMAYTGVACDGRRFQVYRPVYDRNDPRTDPAGEATLENIGSLDLAEVSDAQEAYLWLDGLFAHFRSELAVPTARSIVAALGPGSPTFRRLFPELLALYRRVEDAPEVAVRYRQWQSYLSIVYGSAVGDPALFIRHTYLSLAARLIARLFLEPGVTLTRPEELAGTVHGGYFREQGIDNFIEDDFFTWLLLPEAREEGLDLVRRLAAALAVYNFRQAGQDMLKGLYEGLVDPETRHDLGEYYTPDWLAEYMLDTELGLSADPGRSVFDPACGSGTFLFTAIRLIAAARLQRGEDPFEVLLHLLDQVMGVDIHPVAVTIARANYLLALGDLVRGPHPPVLLPVYLSNALVLPGSTAATEPLGGYPEPVHTVHTGEPGLVFELPHSVAANPQMLDWLFARLPQYLAGAELRSRVQDREEAIQAVLVAFHNYLVAPKARTPIPEPLSAFAAEVMERTARRLIELCLDGQDHLWVFILKNLPASVYLAQRKFDLVVGNPPWLSMRYVRNPQYRQQVRSLILQEYQLLESQDTHLFTHMELATLFFARGADLYLKDGGRIALVMPRAVLTADQHRRFTAFSFKGGDLTLKLERVLDLEGVSPLFNVPACVLVARKMPPLTAPGQREAEPEEIPPGPPLQRGVGGISDKPLQPPTYQGTTYPVPGLVFRGSLPARNSSWSEVALALERTETSFDRQAGKLVPGDDTRDSRVTGV
jgi:methylase of polypeptide subunit release factors